MDRVLPRPLLERWAGMTIGKNIATKREHLNLLQKWMVAQHWAQQSPPLKRATFAVLMRLLDRQNPKSGRCDPSAVGLADETGFTERSVRSAFKELEERGAIKRHRLSGRARNQFLIFSVDELRQQSHLTQLKPRAGKRTGIKLVSAAPETRFRHNVKRPSPETKNETIKKKKSAEEDAAKATASQKPIRAIAAIGMGLGQFEQRVAKVFEKKGLGYEGLLSLPNGAVEGAYKMMAAGEMTFSGAIGTLLAKYESLNEGI